MHAKHYDEEEAQRVRVARWLVPWIKNAHDMAAEAVWLLNRLGISHSDTSLPCSFLLEIGAVARIASWEHAGLKDHISSELPSSRDALAELGERLQTLPKRGDDIGTPLSEQVLKAWTFNCARESRLELGVDIVQGTPDKELLLDRLAEILWNYRHLHD